MKRILLPLRFLSIFCSLFLLLPGSILAHQQQDTLHSSIERLSPELDLLIKSDARLEIIADGFDWVEGPLWVEDQNMLLFSDIPQNKIYKWTRENGKETYLQPSGYTGKEPRFSELGSNGLALDHQGKLLLCQHGDRRIAVMNAPLSNPKPSFTTLANSYGGKKLNSPNDLAIKSNGDIYFTDPPYGLEKNMDDPAKELDFQGVYRVSKNGKVTLLADTISRPNGIAFFPGEKTLLVANSDPLKPNWYIYDVGQNGLLRNGRKFYDGTIAFKKESRAPDGFKIDDKGNVFSTGPGGIWIFNKNGEPLGRIKCNMITSNCAFANDYKTLFITADHRILKIDLR